MNDFLSLSVLDHRRELSWADGVLDQSSMMPWSTLTSGHWKPVTAISYLPKVTSVVTGGEDGQLILWDVVTGYQRSIHGQTVHNSPVSCLAMLPDGSLVVSCEGLMGLIRVAPLPNAPQAFGIVLQGSETGFQCLNSPVTCLAPAPQSGSLLAGCFDGSVYQLTGPGAQDCYAVVNSPHIEAPDARPKMALLLWSLGTGKILLRRLCDPDGTLLLISGGGRCSGRQRSLKCLDILAGQRRPTSACPIFDRTGRSALTLLMVGCSSRGCLDLLVIDSRGDLRAQLHAQQCHSMGLRIVCPLREECSIENDGSDSVMFATAAVNGEIKIWRATLRDFQITIQEICVFRHSYEVTALDFVELPDGRKILLLGDRLGRLNITPI